MKRRSKPSRVASLLKRRVKVSDHARAKPSGEVEFRDIVQSLAQANPNLSRAVLSRRALELYQDLRKSNPRKYLDPDVLISRLEKSEASREADKILDAAAAREAKLTAAEKQERRVLRALVADARAMERTHALERYADEAGIMVPDYDDLDEFDQEMIDEWAAEEVRRSVELDLKDTDLDPEELREKLAELGV